MCEHEIKMRIASSLVLSIGRYGELTKERYEESEIHLVACETRFHTPDLGSGYVRGLASDGHRENHVLRCCCNVEGTLAGNRDRVTESHGGRVISQLSHVPCTETTAC